MDDVDEEEEEEEEVVESEQHLGDMYKRAIRMNAENRINASNSWNLRLIENIDKFLGEEQDVEPSLTSITDENEDPVSSGEGDKRQKPAMEKRVNFTKASCTLDASVKIYSYRVDDVHLTSYKVLANLNRTDNNDGESSKKNSKQKNDDVAAQTFNEGEAVAPDDDDDDVEGPVRSSKRAGTVETNVGRNVVCLALVRVTSLTLEPLRCFRM
jgi:Condensin complex subunit 2